MGVFRMCRDRVQGESDACPFDLGPYVVCPRDAIDGETGLRVVHLEGIDAFPGRFENSKLCVGFHI